MLMTISLLESIIMERGKNSAPSQYVARLFSLAPSTQLDVLFVELSSVFDMTHTRFLTIHILFLSLYNILGFRSL